MMKTLLNKALLLVVMLVLGSSSLFAQRAITIRELNTYPYELTTLDSLPRHPLNNQDSVVKFTAILSSYPRNSGLATYNSSQDTIGRVHLFVVDTTAASLGRDGMAMQIVQPRSAPNFEQIEALQIGTIVNVTGYLTFFRLSAQFNVTTLEDVTDKVEKEVGDLARFDALLDPIEVNVSELNSLNEDGTIQLNLENYTKYAHAYVKVTGGIVQFTQGAIARPNYAIKNNGTEHLVYSNDISLRYRNDRKVYRTGYNIRTAEDGDFVPPPAGAKIDLSGYLVVNNFDAFERVASGQSIFKITPMDDGILNVPQYDNDGKFIGYSRNVNGENGFTWPNDLTIIGFPPSFENVSLNISRPKPGDIVTLSVDILPAGDGITLTSVEFEYAVNGKDTTVATMTNVGATYSFTFPAFEDNDLITYKITATDSEGLVGEYNGSFLVASTINSIATLQTTADSSVADSPYANLGVLNLDITATVVADNNDGLVVVHEAAAPWSGIYLDARIQAVKDLKRGDVINITAAEVAEDRNGTGVTYLSKVEFTKTGENANYADLIPSAITQDVRKYPEAYEGMVVKFVDVKVLNSQADGDRDFGEFAVGSRQGGGAADTLKASDGLRIDGSYPSFGSGVRNFNDNYNENTKVGAVIDSLYGMVYYSFGNPKLLIRQTSDIVSDDWTYPVRTTVQFVQPAANAVVKLKDYGPDSVLTISWSGTYDQDGDTVRYLFGLFAVNGEARTQVALIDSDSSGYKTTLTLRVQDVDDLLANNSVDEGGAITLDWTIYLRDNHDTVQVSTYSGVTFTPVWRSITFERLGTSNKIDELGKAYEFALNQNYPNPFNPSTSIQFSIPTAQNVRLTVYNVLGQQVANLVNQNLSAGVHTVNFDASALSSGVYFYRLEAGNKVAVKKMLLIK